MPSRPQSVCFWEPSRRTSGSPSTPWPVWSLRTWNGTRWMGMSLSSTIDDGPPSKSSTGTMAAFVWSISDLSEGGSESRVCTLPAVRSASRLLSSRRSSRESTCLGPRSRPTRPRSKPSSRMSGREWTRSSGVSSGDGPNVYLPTRSNSLTRLCFLKSKPPWTPTRQTTIPRPSPQVRGSERSGRGAVALCPVTSSASKSQVLRLGPPSARSAVAT